MSEVKDVRDPTGDVSGEIAHDVDDPTSEALSGYLCGVCEEPLPYGATACVSCGTPVAPLDDDEMVAGPYVLEGEGEADGGAAATDLPAVDDVDDPYAPGGHDRFAPPPPATFAAPDAEPAPPSYLGAYDTAANGGPPSGNGHDEPAGALVDLDKPADPAVDDADGHDAAPVFDAEGVLNGYEPYATATLPAGPDHPDTDDLPEYGAGPSPSPSPALDWASPSLLESRAPDPAPGGPRPDAPRRASGASPGRGPGAPLVLVVVVAVLAILAVGAVLVTRGSGSGDAAAPPPAPGPAPTAPAPQVRKNSAPGATVAPPLDMSVPASVDTYCLAALQFQIDPDPDSVAAKFLANPGQLTKAVDILVQNAPDDVRPTVAPLREAVYALAGRIGAGELRTVADLRNALDENKAPAWPHFEMVVPPTITKHCPRYR
jgi:hypothetical protein